MEKRIVVRLLQLMGWGPSDAETIATAPTDSGLSTMALRDRARAETAAADLVQMIACNLPLDVLHAIAAEREYQDRRWGKDKPQSLPGLMLVMRKELEEAEMGYLKDLQGRSSALHELTQVVATGIVALQKYGTEGNVFATDDTRINKGV